MKLLSIYFFIIAVFCVQTFAQEEPLLQQLKDNFQTKSFNVGFLFQFHGSYIGERSGSYNGFYTSNLRLRLSGELDKNYGYLFWVNFVQSPKLLDAKMHYKFSDNFIIDIGQYKAPFSSEYLISENKLDFVARSQAATLLSLGRQTGIQSRGNLYGNTFKYSVGIFNGNGINNFNNNKHLMYVGRLVYAKSEEANSYAFAVNIANTKNSVSGGNEDQLSFGGDMRIKMDKLFISSEFISSKKEFANASATDNGFHITGGYMVKDNMQLLARYDSYSPDGGTKTNYFILGYNVWPTSATEFQMNYFVNTDKSEFKYHQILINCQVAF